MRPCCLRLRRCPCPGCVPLRCMPLRCVRLRRVRLRRVRLLCMRCMHLRPRPHLLGCLSCSRPQLRLLLQAPAHILRHCLQQPLGSLIVRCWDALLQCPRPVGLLPGLAWRVLLRRLALVTVPVAADAPVAAARVWAPIPGLRLVHVHAIVRQPRVGKARWAGALIGPHEAGGAWAQPNLHDMWIVKSAPRAE